MTIIICGKLNFKFCPELATLLKEPIGTMIEHDRLPVVLDIVSYIFPTTYISDLFYQSFSGVSINYVDLLILIFFILLFNVIAIHELVYQKQE